MNFTRNTSFLSARMIVAVLVVVVLALFGAVVSAQDTTDTTSETILLQGQVLDTTGVPIAGAVVELWQADVNGNYNHPNDADPADLIADFQYFGTATADEDGTYAFLTVKPAAYESRPPHLHIKVKIDGEEVLTSQFYFEEDLEAVQADGVAQGGDETLFVTTEEVTHDDGTTLRVATGNLVIDLNGSEADTLTPTTAQTEGPYYPVVDFSDADNNLTSTTEGDELVTPYAAEAVAFTLLNLNTAVGDDYLATIPDFSSRMVREFLEYRPYVSVQQFRREIGKYVDDAQVETYLQYVYVPVAINDADAATIMQIPGVDQTTADALIAARPYASNQAFLDKLSELAPGVDANYAANYLEAE